jgi:succinyl-CoA synthetase beta subunit
LLFLWHFLKQDKRIIIMNIHEYQGKEILASYGVRVQRGIVANNPVEAVAAAKQLTAETGTSWYLSLIHI